MVNFVYKMMDLCSIGIIQKFYYIYYDLEIHFTFRTFYSLFVPFSLPRFTFFSNFFLYPIELHLLFIWSVKIVRVMEIHNFSHLFFLVSIRRNISTTSSTCIFRFLIEWWSCTTIDWCGLCCEKNLRWIWTKGLCYRRAMQTTCITTGSKIRSTRLDGYFKVILLHFYH